MFKKIKKIRTKILLPSLIVLFVALLTTGMLSAYLSYQSTLETLNDTMTETITVAGNYIAAEMNGYELLAKELSGLVTAVPPEDVFGLLEDSQKRHDFKKISITLPDGTVGDTGEDVSQTDFFKIPRDQGITYISDPIMNADNESMNIYISAPIIVNGRFDGIIFITADAKILTDIVSDISVGETGNAAIINKHGTTIAYYDYSTVLGAYNTQKEEKNDPELERLASLEREVIEGKSGFGSYSYGGSDKFMAYAPIADSDGWGMYVTVAQSEFMQNTYTSIIACVVVIILFLILSSIILVIIARSISRPIIEVQKAALDMSNGNFDVDIRHSSYDEAGSLADSMRKMIDTTKTIILDTADSLGEVARGNFDIAPQADYIGVFKGIEEALDKITSDLSDTMSQVKTATDQVSGGAEQVSDSAQALAQGATEQASAVEELSAAINEVSEQIKNNANYASTASQLAVSAGDGLNSSNEQMTDMIDAMSEINTSSEQIRKIIKTIEDIALQTNILALNAAVEAARAGAAGKGFAVVADEVRNLATKSSEAAKQTNLLIEGSVKSVESGVKIVNQTAKSLEEVVVGAQAMAELITKISLASSEQSNSISQINLGVEQISAVVQTNSATSEESAAASEELSGQAAMMKELVSKFKIKQ